MVRSRRFRQIYMFVPISILSQTTGTIETKEKIYLKYYIYNLKANFA